MSQLRLRVRVRRGMAVSNLVSYFHAVVGVHTVGTHKHHARTY
jgi:hypothetical protein